MNKKTDTRKLLFSIPFALSLRNLVFTGLASEIARKFDVDIHLLSPYQQDRILDIAGNIYQNHPIPASQGVGGLPRIQEATFIDRILSRLRRTGFAIEYPNGSLDLMELNAQQNLLWLSAKFLTTVAPRNSHSRMALRRLFELYRPKRKSVYMAFESINPLALIVTSAGQFWPDQFAIDEARRRNIPIVCIVLSWDNLYSRGSFLRRPDFLMVWSDEMKHQAIEVHQFPPENIRVTGALQFKLYGLPVTKQEISQMRQRIGLSSQEPYIAYVCGARTSEYDVEDILAMQEALKTSQFGHFRIVVRPHPQGKRAVYNTLLDHGILLDISPDLTKDQLSPDSFNASEIRHMAGFLKDAEFVISSWGTTALLEACIFDTPAIQLRWMDSVQHKNKEQVQKVRSFQKYIHMRIFDQLGARLYCDSPNDLENTMTQMKEQTQIFHERRKVTVRKLTSLPLEDVSERVTSGLSEFIFGSKPFSTK